MIFFLKVWCWTDRADFILAKIWHCDLEWQYVFYWISQTVLHKYLIWIKPIMCDAFVITQLLKTVMILMNYFDSSLLKMKVPKGS